MKAPINKENEISPLDLRQTILDAWNTNNRVTVFLVENLPSELWEAKLPGAPRRSIRMLAGHLHNARCMWIKTLGKEHGLSVPKSIDRYKVTTAELAIALEESGAGILNLLKFGFVHGGSIPPSSAYVWRNLPLDVGHVLTYFVAHEGHHRGQIVMLARQLGHRLPSQVTDGLWQWSKLARKAGSRDMSNQ
jgi:uncharacterized damage-inducible protein DinB